MKRRKLFAIILGSSACAALGRYMQQYLSPNVRKVRASIDREWRRNQALLLYGEQRRQIEATLNLDGTYDRMWYPKYDDGKLAYRVRDETGKLKPGNREMFLILRVHGDQTTYWQKVSIPENWNEGMIKDFALSTGKVSEEAKSYA